MDTSTSRLEVALIEAHQDAGELGALKLFINYASPTRTEAILIVRADASR